MLATAGNSPSTTVCFWHNTLENSTKIELKLQVSVHLGHLHFVVPENSSLLLKSNSRWLWYNTTSKLNLTEETQSCETQKHFIIHCKD